MKKIDGFINKYSLSKTLRFKLVPVGKTLENLEAKKLLEEDEIRAENYEKVKEYMDRKYKAFTDRVLQSVELKDFSKYISLYFTKNKTNKNEKEIKDFEDSFRKQISAEFKGDAEYGSLFGEKMIKDVLPSFLEQEDEIAIVKSFNKFTTYFTNFYDNRKNLYSAEDKSGSVAYRCINENLPRFFDNSAIFSKIAKALPKENIVELTKKLSLSNGFIERAFQPESFNNVLSQTGIDEYNLLLGGMSSENGEKTKGLNEYINLFNQQHPKEERLPKFKPLRKQVLSDRRTESFIPKAFSSDDELLKAIKLFFDGEKNDPGFKKSVEKTKVLLCNLEDYNLSEIFIPAGVEISGFSARASKNWSSVRDAWIKEYDATHSDKERKKEKYEDDRAKKYKNIKSFSLCEIQKYIKETDIDGELKYTDFDINSFIKREISELTEAVSKNYEKLKPLLSTSYDSEAKNLLKDSPSIELIKNFLDSLKEVELYAKSFRGSGKEEKKDEIFYGELTPTLDVLTSIDNLYNRVRNYLTRKPFSEDKLKLNFRNELLLNGWDISKEKDYKTILLRKNGLYYLGVVDKDKNFNLFQSTPELRPEEPAFEKMNYKLLPGPSKMLPKVFFATKNISFYSPSEEILRIRKMGTFKKGENTNKFDINDCRKLIDFYKDSIKKNHDWDVFGFRFKDTTTYNNIAEFYKEVEQQGYSVTFTPIPEYFIKKLIDEGTLYLFQLYNKDFSENSRGTPNLHTLYFKALFNENNLSDPVYRLNGGAEMFYRKSSLRLQDTTVHNSNQPIKNKNPLRKKETSIFDYDIIKDRRYTKPQFSLHIPITMNFRSEGQEKINYDVRKALQDTKNNYVIGIDRGERNLLYVCVIDQDGRIIEQESMNILSTTHLGVTYETDYHSLLDQKEKERDDARKSWKTIKNIKELKEGYLSHVVNKICNLAVKYDAIIAMEDLNTGFKRSRSKVEKQVYQKFEKMLIDKMNYLVSKKADESAPGGLFKAYQLTEKFTGFKNIKLQNGFIFYVSAWLTSKIDPLTGFVSLFRTHGLSEEKCKGFISSFDAIIYNKEENHFEFTANYEKFTGAAVSPRKQWIICTNGERIETKRNKNKNNNWESTEISITDSFIELFERYRIDYENGSDIRDQCLQKTDRGFFKEMVHLFTLTVQMRNSIANSDVDYLISPVKNSDGKFFDSRKGIEDLPKDADANGAYNIARKALLLIDRFKKCSEDELATVKTGITQQQWLEFAQNND